MKKYKLAAVGGTFDHFHRGHREFLRFALSLCDRLLVGLTTNEYIAQQKIGQECESYQIRKQALVDFLEGEKARKRVEIEPIESVFIPKIWEGLPIETIIVSKNTLSGAEAINKKRVKQGEKLLIIEIFDLIKDSDNQYISSSRIRNGQIDREGKPYINPLWFKNSLRLGDSTRKTLKRPMGFLIKDLPHWVDLQRDLNAKKIITVGDIVTKSFNDLDINQGISVVDFCVGRKKMFFHIKELGFIETEYMIKVNNPAGFVTSQLFQAAADIFRFDNDDKRILVKIEGEEDLAVLPFALACPLGFTIFYGQPGLGVVLFEVSEENKKKAYQLMSEFRITRGH